MTEFYKWFLELPVKFGEIGEWITQTVFTIGEFEVSLLGLLGTGVLGAVIIAKIADLIIPV
jgi:hypothetical protein